MDRATAARNQIKRRGEHVELILSLAGHLDPAERALLEAVYDRGISAAELARAMGLPPRRAHRRLAQLLERLEDRTFRFVIAHKGSWPQVMAEVGDRVYLKGRSQRQTATELGLTLHRVRILSERIRARAEEFERGGGGSRR